jgi:hypothetical protein
MVRVRAGAEVATSPRLADVEYQNMKKSRMVLPKPNKGGRPATGRNPVTAIRLSDEFRAAVDKWAAQQQDKPPRSEAIRRLAELGLTVPGDRAPLPKARPAPLNTGRLARARELAAEAIDKMGDQAASIDERDERRRRLTKGPPEFRDHRVDLPKAKGK